MEDIDLSQFKKLFFDTAKNYVTSLEEGYKRYVQAPTDQVAVEESFIAAHSLKSQSHVMGYLYFSSLAAALEKVFRSIKDGSLQQSEALSSSIGKAVGSLRTSLTTLESTGEDVDFTSVAIELLQTASIKETV